MFLLRIFAVFFLLGLANCAEPKRWAFLVAASNTWLNYRHQADICHAYHILSKEVPAENIITMMYDDIANATQNPNKGTIINKPNGENVYSGVKIDYKGAEVNPTNFLNILQGNKQALQGIGSGKVIESGPEDVIFVNFADHGGVGLLCFPNSYLYANDLEITLANMARAKKFKKMLMYIEACESGSMFDNLLAESDNILVMTASAPDESSYGWYCNTPMRTCLGDLFSIAWMEHMEELQKAGSEYKETIFHQYNVLRTSVNKSHVELYGDFTLGFDMIGTYVGTSPHPRNIPAPLPPQQIKVEGSGVSSREIPVYVAKRKIELAQTKEEKLQLERQLHQLLQKRDVIDATILKILSFVTVNDQQLIKEIENRKSKLHKDMMKCYKNLIDSFNNFCFNTYENTYAVSHFYKFANLCSVSWSQEEMVVQAMKDICSEAHRKTEGVV